MLRRPQAATKAKPKAGMMSSLTSSFGGGADNFNLPEDDLLLNQAAGSEQLRTEDTLDGELRKIWKKLKDKNACRVVTFQIFSFILVAVQILCKIWALVGVFVFRPWRDLHAASFNQLTENDFYLHWLSLLSLLA